MLCGFCSLWWPFGWNWSYLGFLGIIWRTCGSKCRGEGVGIFPTLCVECCLDLSMVFLFKLKKKSFGSDGTIVSHSLWILNDIFMCVCFRPQPIFIGFISIECYWIKCNAFCHFQVSFFMLVERKVLFLLLSEYLWIYSEFNFCWYNLFPPLHVQNNVFQIVRLQRSAKPLKWCHMSVRDSLTMPL